jgi:hypothetical protein
VILEKKKKKWYLMPEARIEIPLAVTCGKCVRRHRGVWV